jgi:response regulator RpfG family c-di-GMP phosphodiesterase
VDDEPRILTTLQRVLRREGYDILTAETGARALALLEKHAVDAVVSDLKMPGMSGIDLLAEVARRHPRTARLLISGWTDDVPRPELEAAGVCALVPKPWDDAELKKALRQALGRA